MDLSEIAIETAKELADTAGVKAHFVCCDIYDLPNHLDEKFDLIFTSYGTIGWLPDLNKWANVISHFLKPGGQFIFVEFHPVVWMFDDDFEHVGYNYFNTGEIVETSSGTYADLSAPIEGKTVNWNHGISEVVNSLILNGLTIEQLNEYDYSPYNCFRHTIEVEPGKFQIKRLENKIPMVYAIVATLGQ
jgi:SAM-dependent methyltransferase